MCKTCSPLARRLVSVAVFCVLVAANRHANAQKIDANINGMSDVWEWIYGSPGLSPSADPDGDGATNALESIAGTNPFDVNSAPRITTISRTLTNFTVSIGCALGKQYSLQSIPGFDGLSNWVTEATTIVRTGTVVSLTAPAGAVPKFFRIAINDVDTDGDGVNDWEEYKLGLDPTKASSNGQLDGNGQAMGDYAYAAGKLASQNVISITATDPSATQPDSGQSAQNFGQFTVTRGGFPLNNITVILGTNLPGAGFTSPNVDHLGLPGSVIFPIGVSSKTITVIPLANTNRIVPAVATLTVLPGSGYTVGPYSNATCTIYPSLSANGTGITGDYYTNSSSTYTSPNNFNPANLRFSRVDTNINFTFGTTTPFPNNGNFCVRWTGQVQPQNTETYYFVANTDDGVKLWVNDQLIIDAWTNKSATDVTATINLQGGARYNLKMEYYQGAGGTSAKLYWYSPSQAKQIIPTSRLYPAISGQLAGPLTAIGFVNQPFSLSVGTSNGTTRFTANPLPPGLSFNTTNGMLAGTPTLAGTFQIMLTASNSLAVSGSGLTLTIYDTGSSVVREVWTNVSGVNVSDIPVTQPANLVTNLSTLEGVTDYGDNYGERIRGYFIPTNTGNYTFWLAASDSAELWISNDGEAVNKVRRAWVTPNGTASRQWNVQANQKSAWLSLIAGQRYYVEILHKAGIGSGDNFAVAWRQDPTGTNTTPAGLVPGYVLSRYYSPPASVAQGALYVADLLPAPGVTNMSYGSATLRMNLDNTRATLNFSVNGVTTAVTEHINNDPYLASPTQIMYDISAASPQPDGSFFWNIGPVGTLSAADVLAVLSGGKAYMIVLSGAYPDGELIGHFALAEGSSTFTPPAAPPLWTDDHANTNAASRFLIQSTFGPSPSDVALVQSLGYSNWIANQISIPATHHLPLMLADYQTDPTVTLYSGNRLFNDWWQISITAPDQLRQRMAFALSEIMVVSDQGVLLDIGKCTSSYYDTLVDNAFGNFRDLLKAVTLTPAMGQYLNMQGNAKGSITAGTHANENYAREIMQLFSIGLNRKWPDGTLVMDSTGNLVPTYGQDEILGFAQVFTGWNYHQNLQGNGRLPTGFSPAADYVNPMMLVPLQHDLNTKLVLDNVVLPQAWGGQANSLSNEFDLYCSQDLELALDSIFNNQNVGPFICRELIQRLVTSQPSPGYLYRVVQKFNDNGNGVRGDLQAVLYAILLDYEARSSAAAAVTTFGKQREPLLRVTAVARAFPAPAPLGGTYTQTASGTVTVTTTNNHRLGTSGDTVMLSFTDTSGKPPPASQAYGVTVNQTLSNFTFGASGFLNGSYSQRTNVFITNALTGEIVTTNVIFATISGHGVTLGQPVWLQFATGFGTSGSYQVLLSSISSNANTFAVFTADYNTNSGSCIMPKLSNGGFTVSGGTSVNYSAAVPHGLSIGDYVYVNFTAAGSPNDGTYQVVSVPDAMHFNFVANSVGNGANNGSTAFPLVPPPLPRSGNVVVQWGTWVINATDTGSTRSLAQTPMNAPTVFNFFFPDYKFPGILTTAGLSTPEFQLTSDTTVAWQMNYLQGGTLNSGNGLNNTNGLMSFDSNNGAIVIDLFPYISRSYTDTNNVGTLVDTLNSLLCGGQLTPGAKTQIVNYVNTLSYGTTPSITQIRDRVRAAVHLVITSPDYTVQR